MSFESLGLGTGILRAVREAGYEKPTPIQAEAIPHILEGRDIMAGAQTGTGKTAGFTLPILELLAQTKNKQKKVHALILVPTRELATQVFDNVQTYSKYLPLRATAIFGGVNIRPQINRLRNGVDILIATPGRLLDHVNQGTLDLSRVQILVLDEADRMLDMGFIPDIRRIMALVPKERQTLLFSATFSNEIKKLTESFLVDPAQVQIATENKTADKINQVIHLVDQKRKREMLSHMVGKNNWVQVLVFTRTKHGANRLTKQLEKDGISAAAIHGNKSQGARTRALEDFKVSKIKVLVATDIAARGLDIHQLPHVVNYELPQKPEDYVHRIGRTGRAGNQGEAISLVCAEESKLLRDIEKLLKTEFKKTVVEGYEPEQPFPIEKARSASQNKNRSGNGNRKPSGQRRGQSKPAGNSADGQGQQRRRPRRRRTTSASSQG